LLGLLFNPEDGDSMFVLNIGKLDHTGPQLRREEYSLIG
jgi:hypothetical protein